MTARHPVYLHPTILKLQGDMARAIIVDVVARESRCLYDERNLSNIPLCPFFSDATSSFDAQHPLTPIVNHVFFLR
jgi:hypothetical protein